MYLINMLHRISCRETASILAITCPRLVWRWRRGRGHGFNSTRTPRRAREKNINRAPNANEITPARAAGEDEMVTAAADGDAGGAMPLRPLFWESPEAAKLFGFNYNSGEDVLVGLRERVYMLSDVLQLCEGYKRVVDHSEEWPLSPEQICYLRNKCLYLCTAYTIA
jgi:hypothetical protein